MKKFSVRFFPAIVYVCLAMLALASGRALAAGAGAPDPMDRPALMITKDPTKLYLMGIATAGSRLVAVGERGVVLYSDDNGKSWKQGKTPTSVSLSSVRFATPKIGVALGHSGVVIKTEDGGETWTKQMDGIQAAQIALKAYQNKALQQCASPEAAQALDCEKINAERLVADGPDKPFLDVFFEAEGKGFIMGAYNLIFRSDDGGKTFQSWLDHVENPGGFHLYKMASDNDGVLYIAGEQGLFLRSDDKGMTFKKLPTPYNGSYFGMLSLKSGEIIVYGLRGSAYRSADKGATWEQINTGLSLAIMDGIEASDGEIILVTSAGEMIVSKDKGVTFAPQTVEGAFPFSSITQAPDGSLALVGMGGIKMVPFAAQPKS